MLLKLYKIQDFDFSMTMINRFYSTEAPFIPENALYNETAERNSESAI